MNRIDKLKAIFNLYKTMYWKYKVQMIFLAGLGFVNGLLGSIGIVALIPLFSYVTHQQIPGDSNISIYFEKAFRYINWQPSLKSLLIAIVAIFIFKAMVLSLFDYISSLLNVRISNEIRKEFYKRTLKSKWSYLVNQKIGHLDYALNQDMGTTMGFLNKMFDAFINLTSFLAYVVTAFALSFNVTLLALTIGAVILFGTKYISGKIRVHAKKYGLLSRTMSHNFNETILGLKAIKTMRAEEKAIGILGDILDQLRALSLKIIKIRTVLTNPIEPIIVVFVAFLFAFAYKQPGFNIASFFVVVYLIQKLFIYTQKFQSTIGLWDNALPSVERIMKLNDALVISEEVDTGHEIFSFKHSIEFKDVSFSYSPPVTILRGASFTIKKGEMAGIIGPSGTGKTTVADMLMRLISQDHGTIFLDGIKIENFTLDSWRRNIGYVSQDVFLMDGTIEANIKFYDTSVNDEDIEYASKIANIFDFVKSLPNGFKTQVGDRGLSLSTGQRQRIALARVLATRPQILILDEATSSLDNESEALIKQSIEKIRGGITIIIIAHRLSTIMDVDHIIAMKDGLVAEEGEPRILVNDKNSYFYKVYATAIAKN